MEYTRTSDAASSALTANGSPEPLVFAAALEGIISDPASRQPYAEVVTISEPMVGRFPRPLGLDVVVIAAFLGFVTTDEEPTTAKAKALTAVVILAAGLAKIEVVTVAPALAVGSGDTYPASGVKIPLTTQSISHP